MKILSLKCFLLIMPIFIFASVDSTNAQSIGFNVGGYHRMNPPSRDLHWEYKLVQKPSISFDIYFQQILDGKNLSRFGLRFYSLSMRNEPVNPSELPENLREGYKYRLNCYLVSYQRELYSQNFFFLMFNFSGGFVTKTPGTTTIFGNFAEGSLSFQPGFDFIFKLYKHVGIQANLRYNFLTNSGEDFYPYSSGIIFEAGLLIELPKVK